MRHWGRTTPAHNHWERSRDSVLKLMDTKIWNMLIPLNVLLMGTSVTVYKAGIRELQSVASLLWGLEFPGHNFASLTFLNVLALITVFKQQTSRLKISYSGKYFVTRTITLPLKRTRNIDRLETAQSMFLEDYTKIISCSACVSQWNDRFRSDSHISSCRKKSSPWLCHVVHFNKCKSV